MYSVLKTKSYEKTLQKYRSQLNPSALERMYSVLETDPTGIKSNSIEKLTNHDVLYRYRLGNYRVLYHVYEQTVTVELITLEPRGSVYKK